MDFACSLAWRALCKSLLIAPLSEIMGGGGEYLTLISAAVEQAEISTWAFWYLLCFSLAEPLNAAERLKETLVWSIPIRFHVILRDVTESGCWLLVVRYWFM